MAVILVAREPGSLSRADAYDFLLVHLEADMARKRVRPLQRRRGMANSQTAETFKFQNFATSFDLYFILYLTHENNSTVKSPVNTVSSDTSKNLQKPGKHFQNFLIFFWCKNKQVRRADVCSVSPGLGSGARRASAAHRNAPECTGAAGPHRSGVGPGGACSVALSSEMSWMSCPWPSGQQRR